MKKSETIAALSAALAKAQADMKNPGFDSQNPHFRNRYASLAAVREAVIPALTKNGLAVTQHLSLTENGMGCTTLLSHESGEWIESTLELPLSKADAQGAGSAATYARRYALMAVCGVVGDDDDDGNQAAAAAPKISEAIKAKLESCKDLGELSAAWLGLTAADRRAHVAIKDKVKAKLDAAADPVAA